MARAEWKINHIQRGKKSYMKRIILIFCSVNVVLALYFLHILCTSLHIFSYGGGSTHAVKYTPEQLMKMAESMQIRKDSEPLELINLVKNLDKEFSNVENVELPEAMKQKIVDDILLMLRNVNSSDENAQRDAMEKWRKEKLEEVSQLSAGNRLDNSNFLPEEAGILLRALESHWAAMLENIGLWMPSQIIHNVHDDAPEGADELDEEDIIPGRPLPPECRAEKHTDYGGNAVRWGLTNPKDSAADCCQACLDQAKNARPGEKKCNIWVYCPSETGCHSPDIYEHKNQECWLKYAEKPKVSFKDQYSEAYRNSHPMAPLIVPWVSGVIST